VSFTDADLARLHELLDDPQSSGFFTEDTARRIIARMEAAEKTITIARAVILNCTDESMHEPLSIAYADVMQEWRKAAGK
jgi:hypothetical protein